MFSFKVVPALSNNMHPFLNQKDTISEKDLGEFPYFAIPELYKFSGPKTKTFEVKYIFNDSGNVRLTEGKYFHATIMNTEKTEFNETFVVNFYQKLMATQGGKMVYSGGLPNKAYSLIKKESPAYVKDLYDAFPYTYKQFLIRTREANIWVELIHGLNANQVDFTVIREEISK